MAKVAGAKSGTQKRVSTKGDFFDRRVPRSRPPLFVTPPNRGQFEALVRRQKLTDEQWNELLSILDVYRLECGYPLQDGDSVSDVRERVRSWSTSLSIIRKKLRDFEGTPTPDDSFPRTLVDFVALTDKRAKVEELPGSEASFAELVGCLDKLIARLGFVEDFITGPDYRFALGTNGMIRTSVTPWVRLINSLSEWWFEVEGEIPTGSGDGPFFRLADAATSIVDCHFTGKNGRGKGFGKALQNALGAARY